MRIPIVDKQDNIIGYKDRKNRNFKDIYRITHVWVFNDGNDFLIARRNADKKISPNCWGPAVSGTVEEGETYKSNATKETAEEIGLRDVVLVPYDKIYYENANGKRFCSIYITRTNLRADEFRIQKEEVAEVRWINVNDLTSWYNKSPEDFIPSMGHTSKLVKEYLTRNEN